MNSSFVSSLPDWFSPVPLALCLTITGLVYLWYSYLYAPYQTFKRVGIPGPKPAPLDGNSALQNELGQLELQKHLAENYGPFAGYYLGCNPLLQVSDLDMLKEIMIKHFNTAFTNRKPISMIFRKDYEHNKPHAGLLDAEDDQWRRTRHILTPTFSAHKMKLMQALIAARLTCLAEKFEKLSAENATIEIHKHYALFTLEVILVSAFGRNKDLQNSEDDRLVQAAIGTFEAAGQVSTQGALFKWISLFPWLPVLLNKFLRHSKMADDWEYVVKSARAIVEKRKKEEQKGNFKDLLQLMLDAGKQDSSGGGEGLTDEEIVAQCEIVLLAGYETTSNTLSYTSYLLALHPDIQDRLREEIEEYFADNPGVSFYEASQQITYLDNVINESQRLHPAVTQTFRVCSKTIDINGVTIPKGTTVAVPIHYIHHNPQHWPEPEKFDPDRFSPEAKAARHSMAFMPFGMGPRNCIGMRFALLETKMALIEILRRFKFVRVPETEVPLQTKVGITTTPKNGVFLKLEAV